MHVTSLFARQAAEIIARLQTDETGIGVQNLAARELNHRLKNVIAMIQALARLSLKGASDLVNFSGTFQARFVTLARAHDTLAKGNWHDASLRAMLRDQLLPLGGERISLSGPEVRISAEVAYLCALSLHELAVNALKHGALSVAKGRVSVDWEVDGAQRVLHLKWVERGGPVVKPPETTGFGSALMRALARSELFEIESTFEPDGLVCTLRLPLEEDVESVVHSEPAL